MGTFQNELSCTSTMLDSFKHLRALCIVDTHALCELPDPLVPDMLLVYELEFIAQVQCTLSINLS